MAEAKPSLDHCSRDCIAYPRGAVEGPEPVWLRSDEPSIIAAFVKRAHFRVVGD